MCKKCPPGTFQKSSGQSECEKCHLGKYCPQNATKPLPCPAGTYQDKSFYKFNRFVKCLRSKIINLTKNSDNAISLASCKGCPAGAYCPEGSQTYINCSIGTYQDRWGFKFLTIPRLLFRVNFAFKEKNHPHRDFARLMLQIVNSLKLKNVLTLGHSITRLLISRLPMKQI